jgi:predicted aldo/keto reductase-like oxidoreductase
MKVVLGQTNLMVNPIGFGGIPIQRLTYEESDRLIKKAVDLGINFFDTSRIYTDSEEKLGRVFSTVDRDKIVIASKTFSRDGNSAIEDLETGLRLFKTDYIDLYQLHNIRSNEDIQKVESAGSVLDKLKEAQKQGKIRYIGLTGHKSPILKKALNMYDFDTLQVPLNYIEQSCLKELIPLAKKKEMGIIAMKPVAGGAFKHVPLVLRFILTHGADVVIPGMDAEYQLLDNLSVIDNLKPLDDKELQVLESEKKMIGKDFCRRCEYCMPCPQGLQISFLHILKAYYFRYNLQDWVIERINDLPKSYKDCIECYECVKKCPYELATPKIFKETWKKISTDINSRNT